MNYLTPLRGGIRVKFYHNNSYNWTSRCSQVHYDFVCLQGTLVQELDDGNSIRDLPSLTACFPFPDPKSTPRREAVKAGSMAIADERVLF
jgi:hypothetical protein